MSDEVKSVAHEQAQETYKKFYCLLNILLCCVVFNYSNVMAKLVSRWNW